MCPRPARDAPCRGRRSRNSRGAGCGSLTRGQADQIEKLGKLLAQARILGSGLLDVGLQLQGALQGGPPTILQFRDGQRFDGLRTLQLLDLRECGLIGGVTPALDQYAQVLSALGDRFVLLRLPDASVDRSAVVLDPG